MFGFAKRIVHRGDDVGDIRSHVLGDRFSDFEKAEPFPARPKQIDYPQPMQSSPYQQNYQEPFEPNQDAMFENRYGEPSPLAPFAEPAKLGTMDRTAEKASRDYDILDRINLIESQVAAIRSMSETINERLKNIEVKLGTRRY